MGGQRGIQAWAREHAFVVVRVSLGLVLAGFLVVFAGDIRAHLDEGPAGASETDVPAWIKAPKRLWIARTRAIANADTHALRRLVSRPALNSDLATARSNDAYFEPAFAGSFAWRPAGGATTMIANVESPPGSPRLVGFVRAHNSRPWRIAFDVPLTGWLWPESFPSSDNRPVPFRITRPLEALAAGRVITHPVAVATLSRGRTIICGGLRDGTAFPNQVCVGVNDAHPDRPYVLGSSRSWP